MPRPGFRLVRQIHGMDVAIGRSIQSHGVRAHPEIRPELQHPARAQALHERAERVITGLAAHVAKVRARSGQCNGGHFGATKLG